MEWIKTSVRKPKPNTTVLVAGGIAYYDDIADCWHSRTGHDTGNIIEWPVTHWAELPSPYDLLDDQIDPTKTIYPSDMIARSRCNCPCGALAARLDAAEAAIAQLRRIAAYVPAAVYIKAKEDAGYGNAIRLRD